MPGYPTISDKRGEREERRKKGAGQSVSLSNATLQASSKGFRKKKCVRKGEEKQGRIPDHFARDLRARVKKPTQDNGRKNDQNKVKLRPSITIAAVAIKEYRCTREGGGAVLITTMYDEVAMAGQTHSRMDTELIVRVPGGLRPLRIHEQEHITRRRDSEEGWGQENLSAEEMVQKLEGGGNHKKEQYEREEEEGPHWALEMRAPA